MSERLDAVRARPQGERNGIFLMAVAPVFALIGVVVLVLTPHRAYVGYAAFVVAVVELVWGAVAYRHARR